MHKFSEQQVQELSQLLENVRDFSNFRHLLAVQMTAPEIEQLTGFSIQSIRQIQAEYFHNGLAVFQKPARGGRRRQNLTLEEETKYLGFPEKI